MGRERTVISAGRHGGRKESFEGEAWTHVGLLVDHYDTRRMFQIAVKPIQERYPCP